MSIGKGWHGQHVEHSAVKLQGEARALATEVARIRKEMEGNFAAAKELKSRHATLKKEYAGIVKNRATETRGRMMTVLDEMAKVETDFNKRMQAGESLSYRYEAVKRRLAMEVKVRH